MQTNTNCKMREVNTAKYHVNNYKRGGEDVPRKNRNSIICDFKSDNSVVFRTGIIAFSCCLIWTIVKASSCINIPKYIQLWGELFYNIAISIIAAVFFYIAQVYLQNRNRNLILKKYAKRYVKENLLKQIMYLDERVKSVIKGDHAENEIRDAISNDCNKIQYYIDICLNYYNQVLPEECIDGMYAILFNDYFFSINQRAKQNLKNESICQIFSTPYMYNDYSKLVDKIKNNIDKI